MRRKTTMSCPELPEALLEVEYEATAEDYLGDDDEQWPLVPEPMLLAALAERQRS